MKSRYDDILSLLAFWNEIVNVGLYNIIVIIFDVISSIYIAISINFEVSYNIPYYIIYYMYFIFYLSRVSLLYV